VGHLGGRGGEVAFEINENLARYVRGWINRLGGSRLPVALEEPMVTASWIRRFTCSRPGASSLTDQWEGSCGSRKSCWLVDRRTGGYPPLSYKKMAECIGEGVENVSGLVPSCCE